MYKIALINITLNVPYWSYLGPMIESARKFLLKGHQVDYFTWSDMPQDKVPPGVTLIPMEPIEWPLPTLMRYHLFLKEEERLKDYDFIFYIDADMDIVSPVGDEILGEGLTAAQHPMYSLRREYTPPYEPNPESASFIPRPGKVITINGKKQFQPQYYAGGFQGGRADMWITAMKEMKAMVDKDFSNNYIPIWNDESVWNKYLFTNPPSVVLSPSYIYPDSLNKAYYQKAWGRNYVPKIITITKPFSTTKEGGEYVREKIKNL